MRYRLNRVAMIAFVALLALVVFSPTRQAAARPCTSSKASAAGSARRAAFVPDAFRCVKEYLTEGPLYNPTFTYSSTSLSFEIPTMTWSAFGKAMVVPATHAKVVPNSTTYWFLRVPDSSPGRDNHGSFVSSMSSVAGKNELLEYVVASSQSGIDWVRFPMPAQVRQVDSDDASSNSSEVEGSALTGMVAQAQPGVRTDALGDGFFEGAVVANAGLTPSTPSYFTAPYYGVAVIAQSTPHAGVPSPVPQPGEINILHGLLAGFGHLSPTWETAQIAVGFPNTESPGPTPSDGLTGLFTAGTAGSFTNGGNGVLAFGNYTQADTWTQIGASAKHNISEIHNSVYSVLAEYSPNVVTSVGCVVDAAGNQGCSGGLYGNAAATPFPLPANPLPPPATGDPRFEGPAVIAQQGSLPNAQLGNVLINGTLAALEQNACTAPPTLPTGVPCEFTWTIPSPFTGGLGSTTVFVPGASVCTVTPTQNPIISSGDVITTWVTLSGTVLTVHAQDLQGTAMGPFVGNGSCS